MTFWTLDRVGQALRDVLPNAARRGALPRGREALGGVCTDTRSLKAGDVFVAIRGERFDAHDFVGDAVAAGAAALVLTDATRATGLGRPVFAVPDTTSALGALGAYRRRAWGGTVVAVAGSNGKTTTKELVRGALDGLFRVHATQGNLNNQIGVPLTLLEIPDDADVAVVEVGTNQPGEIELLRRMVAPDVALLTSIGEEHLEGLGDIAGVLREESAVFRGVPLAVAPASQPEVGRAARTLAQQTVEAGLESGDLHPDRWGLDESGRGWAEFGDVRVSLTVRGAHNLRNAMLAMAVARACGVPLDIAARGLALVEPLAMRGVWQTIGSLVVINDAYNANPASMREAISLLDGLSSERPRVLVLGGMRELGPASPVLHEEIAHRALESGASLVAGIGAFAAPLQEHGPRDRVITASDIDDLWKRLAPRLPRNAVVLLKASRGERLERLLPLLTKWAEEPQTEDGRRETGGNPHPSDL